MTITTDSTRHVPEALWHLGAMNDGSFIINAPPRPSNDEVWHDRPDGPTLALPVHQLPTAHAQAIVDAHNAAVSELKGVASALLTPPVTKSMVPLTVIGWLHTLYDENRDELKTRFEAGTQLNRNPFGRRGVDFDKSFKFISKALVSLSDALAPGNRIEAGARTYDFEGGHLVKVNGERPEYMSGTQLIGLVRELALSCALTGQFPASDAPAPVGPKRLRELTAMLRTTPREQIERATFNEIADALDELSRRQRGETIIEQSDTLDGKLAQTVHAADGTEFTREVTEFEGIGRSFMAAFDQVVTDSTSPFHKYSPADDPVELVFDLHEHVLSQGDIVTAIDTVHKSIDALQTTAATLSTTPAVGIEAVKQLHAVREVVKDFRYRSASARSSIDFYVAIHGILGEEGDA